MRTSTLLSTPEVAERAGVTYRQIDHWARIGLITPTIEADGPGSRRRWERAHVAQIAVIGRVSRQLSTGAGAGAPHDILVAAAEHWADGRVELGEGVAVTWTIPGIADTPVRDDGRP